MRWYKAKAKQASDANQKLAGFEDEHFARSPRASAIATMLRSMGLAEIGSRSGKAGVQFGIEGKARRASVGSRELILNYFLVSGGSERWNMFRSLSMKQLLDKPQDEVAALLQSVANWINKAPTTIEVRNAAAAAKSSNGYADGIRKIPSFCLGPWQALANARHWGPPPATAGSITRMAAPARTGRPATARAAGLRSTPPSGAGRGPGTGEARRCTVCGVAMRRVTVCDPWYEGCGYRTEGYCEACGECGKKDPQKCWVCPSCNNRKNR